MQSWYRRENPEFQIFVLVVLFSGAYVAVLLPRAIIGDVFDRYLIPLLPIAGFGILWCCQTKLNMDRPPLIAWFLLSVYGFYSVRNCFKRAM